MSLILLGLLPILGVVLGCAIGWQSARFTPLFKPGTPVEFEFGGDCTGIYVRHESWGGYHRVRVTGPGWWSAAREGREVVVHKVADRLHEAFPVGHRSARP